MSTTRLRLACRGLTGPGRSLTEWWRAQQMVRRILETLTRAATVGKACSLEAATAADADAACWHVSAGVFRLVDHRRVCCRRNA